MNYNKHYHLAGKHAFLSASSYHWVNYSPEKLRGVYTSYKAKEEGTILHDFASVAITRRLKMANHKKSLNMFVNDAIGYRMQSELTLYYSDNCFGTADAILLEEREGIPDLLRIHDLKTGYSKVSTKQLEIYAALFCLEYGVVPESIEYELRIYQHNDIQFGYPTSDEIRAIMEKIVEFDKIIDEMKLEIG